MTGNLEQIVEQVVSQVLEGHVAQVRGELVRRVLEQIQPHLGARSAPAGGNSSALLQAVSAVQAGASQREILRALLENMAAFSGRSALFVVRGGAATGWQGRGFANNDGVKDFQLDVNHGGAAKALQARTVFSGKVGEMGDGFSSTFGVPGDDRAMVLPLLLKDKVAALVYADPGDSGSLDAAALEILVVHTGAWLEVVSTRKVQKDAPESAPERAEAPAPAPAQAAPSFSDPFAGHAPRHVVAPAPPAANAAVASAAESPAGAAAPAPAADPFAGMSQEDADLHRKAQRFARLLVDEIKLYNHVKVTEGRKHKDLYDRLKEDIEKSRGTYQKRYGNTAAASADYFTQEVIRSLAEDDVSFMGANFKR